ncbi:uncharacterized protein LOC119066382 [Bradysia coprophila]|uniref:uncharacterized protein LOC119066382 n=1 Tax=Bradysia coprophila TaxID=38358 RepID=UPI00187DD528|nr:uncharacterized protein LOC119066382 [Bradysia coprophila]
MSIIISIREMKSSDRFNCEMLVKDYILQFINEAFLSCLFREITLQAVVLLWAIMFIIFGVPLLFCITSIPIVIVFMYFCVYATYWKCAMEMSIVPVEQTWVAESYEPLFLRQEKEQMDYVVVNEDMLLTRYPNAKSLRRNLVGTIGLTTHRFLDNCGWINRMAVNPKYSFHKVGEPLVTCLLEFCVNKGIYTVESTSTECQYTKRELLLKMGFTMKQIYHKQIIGSSVQYMKSQLGINLEDWIQSKRK